MFIRKKRSGPRTYLQIVENRREKGKVKQRVIATLGRLDELLESGKIDGLIRSAAKFCEKLMVLDSHRNGKAPATDKWRIGPPMIFERLWRESACQAVIEDLLEDRNFQFPVERAIFTTVLHGLCSPGSDRSADKWYRHYRIPGAAKLQLHHFYRAVEWLGTPLEAPEQKDATPFAPRCVKDLVEEELFAARRDLFTTLHIVFLDTTSLYFEGEGGETIGQYGHSRDKRPDRKQMVVCVVLDDNGRPLCCELWPGNVTDVTVLIPVVDRLRKRFAVNSACVVADRGMMSQKTIKALERRKMQYIIGERLRKCKEVKEEVLSRAGSYHKVPLKNKKGKETTLKVKEVYVDDRRYIVCLNEEEAQKDAADREKILEKLREKLAQAGVRQL